MIQSPRTSIAILFFSRSAEKEAGLKPFLKVAGPRTNAAIARELIGRTKVKINQSGLDVHHFHEGNQRGGTFGEKLANAFADLFALGYRAAIAVGNDCPELARMDWPTIQNQLLSGKGVTGPDFRGGAYLIGVQACGFDANEFSALPWQTEKLYSKLISCLEKQGKTVELHALQDLNTDQDLWTWVRGSRDSFARRLKALCEPVRESNFTFHIPQEHAKLVFQLRGPPR